MSKIEDEEARGECFYAPRLHCLFVLLLLDFDSLKCPKLTLQSSFHRAAVKLQQDLVLQQTSKDRRELGFHLNADLVDRWEWLPEMIESWLGKLELL